MSKGLALAVVGEKGTVLGEDRSPGWQHAPHTEGGMPKTKACSRPRPLKMLKGRNRKRF